jgi:hypothetical protein
MKKIEPKQGENVAVEKLLTSQLLARYHFLGDNLSLDEYRQRMNTCDISKEKADALIDSEIEIISRLDKKFLTEPDYIKSWFFSFDKANLREDPIEYLVDREFTVSEISFIFDEANWHSHNSRNKGLADVVWNEICKFCARGEKPILNVAVTALTLLGWSLEEAHRYLFNEKLLIDNVRWGYTTAQAPFTPNVSHPNSEAFKKDMPPETDQVVVDAYKNMIQDNTFKGKVDIKQRDVGVQPVKRKGRGLQRLFLGLTIFFGFFVFVGIAAAFEDIEALFLLIVYIPLFALFLWLYLRKRKKNSVPDAPIEPVVGELSEQSEGDNECCRFSCNTAHEAMMGRSFEDVEVFSSPGSDGEGYSWSDGIRTLCKCRKCGTLFLFYRINFLPMTYEQVNLRCSFYFPVSSRTEALEYSQKYVDPRELREIYKGKKIWFDGNSWCWDKP